MSGSLFDWIGNLFSGSSAAANAADDAASAASAVSAANPDTWNLTNVVPASSLPPSQADSWDLYGYGAGGTPAGGTWDQIAGGAGKVADAMKKLTPAGGGGGGQGPAPMGGAAAQLGHPNANALAPLVQMLQQRQQALLTAQQQGAPPPQIRTVGLLGF
jgi:hypothetical protein